jgi:hypothetical protein
VDHLKKQWKFLSIALLSAGMFSSSLSALHANGISFKDVPADFWGKAAIQWAVDNKVVDGYPDGTFKPNDNVDQNEFLALLIRAYQPNDFTPNTDSSDWASPYLSYAGKLGWSLPAASPSITHPTNRIGLTRGMVAKYLANATGKNFNIADSIQYVLDMGLAEGKTGKTVEGFKQDTEVTRAEAVMFIQRLKQAYHQLQPIPAAEEKYEAQSIIYHNTNYNFSLKLPKSWEGKYEVTNQVFEDGTENVEFFNLANKTAGGLLFSVQIMPKEDWIKNGEEMISIIGTHVSKIGEKGDQVFLMITPTDVQFALNDEKVKAEYDSMFNDIESIKASFHMNN